MQPHEITAEVLTEVSLIMDTDGLRKLAITEALIHMGRFL
jgi:hypothetical protein